MMQPARRSAQASNAADTSDGRVWSMAEYEALCDDISRGRYVGREALAKSLQADYMRAFSEGRVVMG
jgi:hypothetical protein